MIETDYLIIGSGAMGMAFADTLLSATEANIVIVDRYAKPGGHWNVAYPFVTLHQPSQFYGVASKEMSRGRIDKVGLNKGLYDLATGAEVSAYYEEVMKDTFLPSGRVQYFPLCDYKGNFEFESMITGERHQVKVNKKLVDCTYLNTNVPSTHTPNFNIAKGVSFMALNDLPTIKEAPKEFVVIGGGKTGIDACIWLLENRVDPDKITWIVSRDGWLINRENTQPGEAFFEKTIGTQANQMEAIAKSTSIPNLFDNLEEAGVFLRLDKKVRPEMFHGATVSKMELAELQKIKKVIRLGRVQRIEKDEIILDKGTIPTSTEHIHVDCSASAISNLVIKPVFTGEVITPQTVRAYQPVFSASVIAYIEAHYDEDKVKNNLCQVVPLPNADTDWIPMTATQMVNQMTWSKDKPLRRWVRENRLDGFGQLVAKFDRTDEKKVAIMQKFRDHAIPAMMKLQQFMTELNTTNQKNMKNPQFQVRKDLFFKGRLVDTPATTTALEHGEVLVKVDKFAYTANNITYAVAADMVGYWQFFPAVGDDADGWGVIPVWGFAEVVDSRAGAIPIGDRLFGYFPPAGQFKMKPIKVSDGQFIDGMEHRSKLPVGYNVYRRVQNEKGYNPAFDRERMLLFPLHLTSFCLWDSLQEVDWHEAKQVIILSASSKTSTGLGYAVQADENAPPSIGITSAHNLEMVKGLNIYDQCLTYDQVTAIDASIPTVIVDMSGNAKVLVALHEHLGDNMRFTSNVGLTHWTNASPTPPKGIISERSKFFFAPAHIQKRLKEWGADKFDQRTSKFLKETAAKTRQWLSFKTVDGLEGLAAIHGEVCEGKNAPDEGLIVEL